MRNRLGLLTATLLVCSCGTTNIAGDRGAATGQPCAQAPSASVAIDHTVAGRRSEALIKHLTGIDELVLHETQEGIDIIYDDPNYGGVWGDFNGGWIVAVLDCDKIDVDRIAALAGGPDTVSIIQVPHTFEEVNGFKDLLAADLEDSGVAGELPIDSTNTGRHIRVVVADRSQLDKDFGSGVPPGAFTVEEGELSRPVDG